MSIRPSLLGAVAGGLVGLVVAGLLVTDWRAEPVVTGGEEAAAAFADAWERSRLETYYMRGEVVRRAPKGELVSELEVAQRPPDVVRRQYGGLWGRQGDRLISCVVDGTETVSCRPGGAELPPHEQDVADEMGRWVSYLEGDPPLYAVTTEGDGCFDLTLTQLFPAPAYGTNAQFCFDTVTGAMISSRIERDQGTEVMQAVEVRAEVTDADFALPS